MFPPTTVEPRHREFGWFEVLFPTAAPPATRIRAIGAAVQLRAAIRVTLVSALGVLAAVSLGTAFDAVMTWNVNEYLSDIAEFESVIELEGVFRPLLVAIFAGWLAVRLWKRLDSAPLADWVVLEAARSPEIKPDDIACDSGLPIAAIEASCWRMEAAGAVQEDPAGSGSGEGLVRFRKRQAIA